MEEKDELEDFFNSIGATPVNSGVAKDPRAYQHALTVGSNATKRLDHTVTPRNAQGVTENTVRAMDLDDGGIRHQEEQKVFDGSTYTGNPTADQEIWESVGQPGMLGTRIQTLNEGTPEQQKYYVPEPAISKQGVIPSLERSLVGGVLQAAKGAAVFSEWAVDESSKTNVPFSSDMAKGIMSVLDFADWLLDPNTEETWSDANRNFFDENVATLPAQNEWEAMGQEITSMAIGGVAGAKIVEAATKTAGPIGGWIGKVVDRFSKQAKTVDTANFPQKVDMFVKALLAELGGASAGASITQPEETQSISANGMDILGQEDVGKLLPDQLGTMNESQRNRVGSMIDNLLLGTAGKTAGAGLKAGLDKLTSWFKFQPSSPTARQGQQLLDLAKRIDPGIDGASEEEVIKRMALLGEIVEQSNTVPLDAMGTTIKRNTTNAVTAGAKRYVETAYGYLKNQVSPEEWDEFVTQHTEEVVNNIAAVRRANLSNTTVQAADAASMRQADAALSTVEQGLGDTQKIVEAGETIGAQAENRLKGADSVVAQMKGNDLFQQQRLAAAQGQASNVTDLAGPRDPLGATTDIDAEMAEMTGPTMFNAMRKSIEETDAKFASIPDGVDFDREALADLIIASGDSKNILADLNIQTPSNPVKPTFVADGAEEGVDNTDDLISTVWPNDAPKAGTEAVEDGRTALLDRLEGMDLKTLYTNVRPSLARMLDEMSANPKPGQQTGGLVEIKRFIDEAAEASGDPSFSNAMDSYRTDMDLLGGFSDFGKYRDNVRSTAKAGEAGKVGDVYEQGYLLTQQAANDPTGRRLEVVTNIINRYDKDNSARLGSLMLAEAARDLATSVKPGSAVTSTQLQNAIKPRLRALAITNKDAVARYRQIVSDLEKYEAGSAASENALKQAELWAKEQRTSALEQIGADFLVKQETGGLAVGGAGDITKAFDGIFGNEGKTTQLLEAAAKEGPEVLEGIQAQYVRYLRGKVETGTPLSGGGDNVVMNSSGSRLARIIDGSDLTPLAVLDKVFANKPELLGDFKTLLTELQRDNLARQLKPMTFGSNTAVDLTSKKGLGALTTVAFGALSRAGAIARSFINMSTSVDQAKFSAEAEQFLGEILADSDKFAELMKSGGSKSTMQEIQAKIRELYDLSTGPVAPATVRTVMEPSDEDDQTKRAFALN